MKQFYKSKNFWLPLFFIIFLCCVYFFQDWFKQPSSRWGILLAVFTFIFLPFTLKHFLFTANFLQLWIKWAPKPLQHMTYFWVRDKTNELELHENRTPEVASIVNHIRADRELRNKINTIRLDELKQEHIDYFIILHEAKEFNNTLEENQKCPVENVINLSWSIGKCNNQNCCMVKKCQKDLAIFNECDNQNCNKFDGCLFCKIPFGYYNTLFGSKASYRNLVILHELGFCEDNTSDAGFGTSYMYKWTEISNKVLEIIQKVKK